MKVGIAIAAGSMAMGTLFLLRAPEWVEAEPGPPPSGNCFNCVEIPDSTGTKYVTMGNNCDLETQDHCVVCFGGIPCDAGGPVTGACPDDCGDGEWFGSMSYSIDRLLQELDAASEEATDRVAKSFTSILALHDPRVAYSDSTRLLELIDCGNMIVASWRLPARLDLSEIRATTTQ